MYRKIVFRPNIRNIFPYLFFNMWDLSRNAVKTSCRRWLATWQGFVWRSIRLSFINPTPTMLSPSQCKILWQKHFSSCAWGILEQKRFCLRFSFYFMGSRDRLFLVVVRWLFPVVSVREEYAGFLDDHCSENGQAYAQTLPQWESCDW